MKKALIAIVLLLGSPSWAADVKISELPLGDAATTSANDSIPYADSVTLATRRLELSDLPNIPSLAAAFPPIASPTFTGVVTAPGFVGDLTGTASGNTSYTADNHGVVLSGSTNSMSVLAPDASAFKVLTSGGASADPTWSLLSNANLSGSAAISNANLAPMADHTVKGNISGSSATPSDIPASASSTANTVVLRDGSGNFAAAAITANLTGAASLNVLKAGDTMSGVLNMGGNEIQGVLDPVFAQDAATKAYVDAHTDVAAANVLLVSTNGTDAGTCSASAPCHTLFYALSQITTNSSTNRFVVVLGPGAYVESNSLVLKHDVSIVGLTAGVATSIAKIDGTQIVLDLKGSSGGDNARQAYRFLTITNGLSIDRSSATSTSTVTATAIDDTTLGSLTVTGYGNEANDSVSLFNFAAVNAATIVHGALVQGFSSRFLGAVTIDESGATFGSPTTQFQCTGGLINAALNINGSGSTAGIRACLISTGGSIVFGGSAINAVLNLFASQNASTAGVTTSIFTQVVNTDNVSLSPSQLHNSALATVNAGNGLFSDPTSAQNAVTQNYFVNNQSLGDFFTFGFDGFVHGSGSARFVVVTNPVTGGAPASLRFVSSNYLTGEKVLVSNQSDGDLPVIDAFNNNLGTITHRSDAFINVVNPAVTTAVTVTFLQRYLSLAVAIVSSSMSLTTDNDVILCNAIGGAVTVTLPDPATDGGHPFKIKKIDSSGNACTVASVAGTIDGSSTNVLSTQYQSGEYISNLSNYFIF